MQIYKMTDCFTDKNELNLVSGDFDTMLSITQSSFNTSAN